MLKFYFQRSWYFYKPSYGTFSLIIHSNFLSNAILVNIFHWPALLGTLSEVEFRKILLNKLPPPPWKGLRGYFSRAVYAYYDRTYPTRVSLYSYNQWQQFIGSLYARIILFRHKGSL